jgi:hypothetical protein
MALCIPLIVGLLTEWSDSICVQGCLPGATIRISCIGASPRDLGEGIASGGIDRIPLRPGERLHASDRVMVSQKLGGEHSEPMPEYLAVSVASAPTDHGQLAPLSILSRLFACGGAIWVAGAVPGAQVRVGAAATGRANESGDARLTHPGFHQGQPVVVWQEAPAGFPALTGSPKQTSAQVDRINPLGAQLPVPILAGSTPKGCDPSIVLAGIIDGAEVALLHRSTGTVEKALFDRTELRFDLAEPIPSGGDELQITQDLIRCAEWRKSDPLIVHAGPAVQPKTPKLNPPCPDSYDVYASDLEPGAIATLTFDADTYRAMVPQDATAFVFRLTRLHSGGTVTLQQEKCALISGTASVQVPAPRSGSSALPDLEEPLLGCARAVRVRARPGTWLEVRAKRPTGDEPISEWTYCSTGSVQVFITSHLVAGDDIWLNSLQCGATAWRQNPNIHRVQATPDLIPPQITTQLVEGAWQVIVDAFPGAYVEIYAFTPAAASALQMIGTGVVDPLLNAVPLWRPIALREIIYATQSLCGPPSRPSAARTAIPNTRTFYLPAPLKRLSNQSSSMKPLLCNAATMVCHHDGQWLYTAEFENQETEADCSFDLQFDLLGINPPFGASLPGALSAAGDGPVTEVGLRTMGTPSADSFTAPPGNYSQFRDPDYWGQVYNAAYKFDLTSVAWENYAPSPDEGEYEDKDDDPKKPGTSK